MKYTSLVLPSLLAAGLAGADIVPFDLSPPGTSPGTGLSPANEVPAVTVPSEGSGGEVFGGIVFDTETRELTFALGYGSAALFTDLTGPATAAHIHGPAGTDASAGPVHNFFVAGQHLPAGDPARGGVIMGAVVLTEEQAVELLNSLYYINIHTAQNGPGEIRGQLVPVLNAAPTIACPDPVEVECQSPEGSTVNLTVQVADADGDPLEVVWTIDGTEYQTDTVPGAAGGTDANVHFTGVFGFGTHSVSVSVSDGSAEPVVCETTVTVVDTLPPEVTDIVPSQRILWPPNHKMIPVTVSVTASDLCGPVVSRIVEVTSDEPVDGIGDGSTSPDWEVTGNLSLLLRAERAGPGDGRVYTITVETADHAGHAVTTVTEVRVPHDMGKDAYVPGTPESKNAEKGGKRVVPAPASTTATEPSNIGVRLRY